MRDLTSSYLPPRQLQVLAFIHANIRDAGYPPTVREITRELGCSSSNAAVCPLDALVRKGYITREAMSSRGIRLTDRGLAKMGAAAGAAGAAPPRQSLPMPGAVKVYSGIYATAPRFREAAIVGVRRLDRTEASAASSGKVFGIRIPADTLGLGLLQGDEVFFSQALAPTPGALVCALEGGGALLCRAGVACGVGGTAEVVGTAIGMLRRVGTAEL